MTKLSVRGIVAGHGPTTVLHEVDLEVPSGSTTAILGPSGCGKTTLLRVIAGFHRPVAGQVCVGEDVVVGPGRHVPPEHRGIGYVAQEGALFPHLSVGDNVGFGLSARDRGRQARITELLDLVGLPREVASRRPDQLSGGQQQRVALARALARRPKVILLDEPFSSLDAGLRTSTRHAVAVALEAEGVTVLLVTHDQDEALSFADQVVVMDAGVVRQVGAPEQVYAAPSDRMTAAFLGDLVSLPGSASGELVECPLGCLRLVTPMTGQVEVALRPEQVHVAPLSRSPLHPEAPAPGSPSIAAAPGLPHDGIPHDGIPHDGLPHDPPSGSVAATVRHTDYFGHDLLVHAVLDDGTSIMSRLAGSVSVPKAGDRVAVSVLGPVLAFPF